MPYDLLLLERDPPLVTITLNRPDKRNALSHALRVEIAGALKELEADDAISVAILTGAGTVFCAGFDRSEFTPDPGTFDDPDRWQSGQLMHEALQSFGKPLIGAINGPALGGGFDIATQCDVRIASDAAAFGHPEIKFGAPTLYTILSQIVGGAIARDLCLSGRRIDANEAHRIGLVTQVVPADRLTEESVAYAKTVAEAPPDALKAVKAAIVRETPFRVP
ncbi:MAG TPA: enoyl-CoA hydratase/isomerase family protein [Actinomycetota bacterium]|nr:enoyl-CoA hydratase/isomerase family protein [Actinomycetota bacterium]